MKTEIEIRITERVDTIDGRLEIEIENGEVIVRDPLRTADGQNSVILHLSVVDADFLAESIRAAIAEYARINDEVARGMMRFPMEGAK